MVPLAVVAEVDNRRKRSNAVILDKRTRSRRVRAGGESLPSRRDDIRAISRAHRFVITAFNVEDVVRIFMSRTEREATALVRDSAQRASFLTVATSSSTIARLPVVCGAVVIVSSIRSIVNKALSAKSVALCTLATAELCRSVDVQEVVRAKA